MKLSDLIKLVRHETMMKSTLPNGESTTTPWLHMSDGELLDTIKLNAPLLNVKDGAFFDITDTASVYELDETVAQLLLDKCKLDIILRIALGECRNYPIEAEGASIRKNVIFDNYMELIKGMRTDFKTMLEEFKRGSNVRVITATKGRRTSYTDLRLATLTPNARIVDLNATTPKSSIELAWDAFLNEGRGFFYKYEVHVAPKGTMVFDAVARTMKEGYQVFHSLDPLETSTRVSRTAGVYEVTLAVYNTLGMYGTHVIEVTVV